jgi:hypothetical protein
MTMESERYDVPVGTPGPTVALQVLKDSESGWNLDIQTTNFAFAPQHVGGAEVASEGHAHVLVDGTMVGRAYSEWYYLGALPAGAHTITVELETNDHKDYYVNGVQVATSTTVVSAPASGTMHSAPTGAM